MSQGWRELVSERRNSSMVPGTDFYLGSLDPGPISDPENWIKCNVINYSINVILGTI